MSYINRFVIGYKDEEATLSDLKDALDARPKYPHQRSKKGTAKLVDRLLKLDSAEREKVLLLRTIKAEHIRSALAESIEKDNIRTAQEAWNKSVELMKKYNDRPSRPFLDC